MLRVAFVVEKQLVQSPNVGGATGGLEAKSPVSDLVLGDIRIVNGTVRYTDERDGTNAQVGAINASLDLASLSQPLGAKGSLVWSKEEIGFDGKLTSPQQLLEERPAKLALTVSSRPIRPLRANSHERRQRASERRCEPHWNTRSKRCTASAIARPSRMVKLSGFSQ